MSLWWLGALQHYSSGTSSSPSKNSYESGLWAAWNFWRLAEYPDHQQINFASVCPWGTKVAIVCALFKSRTVTRVSPWRCPSASISRTADNFKENLMYRCSCDTCSHQVLLPSVPALLLNLVFWVPENISLPAAKSGAGLRLAGIWNLTGCRLGSK